MDTGWITNNIGAIIGGLAVIVVAYILFRPKTNKNPSDSSSRNIIDEKSKANQSEDAVSSPAVSVNEKQTSPVWKTRRYILNKIRSLKKPDILSGKHPDDSVDTIDKNKEPISSPAISLVADPSPIVSEVQEEKMEIDPAVDAVDDIQEIPLLVDIDDTNAIDDEFDQTNAYESTDDESSVIDIQAASPTDETGIPDNNQFESAVTNNEQFSKKPEEGSDVFSLFTEEDEDENEISKFAANLEQVDVNNLLKDAENIQKHIRR